jgi:hypothetical protein
VNAGPARPNAGTPLDRGLRDPRQDEPPPRRRAPNPESDEAYRQPPRRKPRGDGWSAETESDEEDDSPDWRQSARRQAMRPRPRRPADDDSGDWDDGYTPPRPPRGG